MAVPSDIAPSLINTLLQEPLFSLVLLPIGYGVFRLAEHAIRRKMEGKPESEKLDQYHKLADLHEKLQKAGASMADLDALRAHALGEVADTAITVAKTYTGLAHQLVSDYETARQNGIGVLGSGEGVTQADMNQLSGQMAAQVDDELATVVAMIVSGMDEDSAQALLQSQQAWEAFRQSETLRESQRWQGGSIRPLMANSRYEALTRERIAVLSSEGEPADAKGDIVIVPPQTPRNLFEVVELSRPPWDLRGWR